MINIKRIKIYSKITIISSLVMVIFLCSSCGNSIQEIKQLSQNNDYPGSVAQGFRMVYTDSTRVQLVLESPVHKDYSNQDFQYNQFPEGIKLTFFDKKKRKTTAIADQAIIYRLTNIVQMQGNVKITTFDGKILTTDKLYWNRKSDWIFTEDDFSYTNPEEGTIMDGTGIDFSKDFSKVIAHKTKGIVSIKDKQETEN